MSIKKTLVLLTISLLPIVLSACSIPFIGGNKKAALQINSTPKATVFLNDQHAGTTPFFDENLKEGEFIVKLVPETTGATVDSWEGRVKLTSGILTVVSRDLAALEEDASGYILTLEPITDKSKSALSVVSTPDKAIVTLDGEPKGFAPLSLENLSEGDHNLLVSLPGHKEKEIKAKAVNGYKLILSVQLAKDKTGEKDENEATESAQLEDDEDTDVTDDDSSLEDDLSVDEPDESTSSANLDRPYVTINSPEVGWVRVRAEDSTSSEELAKVNDGESYKLIDTTPVGWYQIEYAKGKEGWISGKYAEKYE
jgi:hypothetical protein